MDLHNGIVEGWQREYERYHAKFRFWEKWGLLITMLLGFPVGLAGNWWADATDMPVLTQVAIFLPAGIALATLGRWRVHWLADRTNYCLRAWKQTYAAFDREGIR